MIKTLYILKLYTRDFPGGAVVKNLPANAGDTRSIPGLGRSHMPWATKPMGHNYWACALEPARHNYWAHMSQLLKPVCLEPVFHNDEQPLLATATESPHAATKTQCNQK